MTEKSISTEGTWPVPVSFRELVPEVRDTGYLTHGLIYYPARFIPQIPRFCLRTYTEPTDWVIDPFAGSGTVGLEAVLMNRNAMRTAQPFSVELPASPQGGFLGSPLGYGHPPEPAPQA